MSLKSFLPSVIISTISFSAVLITCTKAQNKDVEIPFISNSQLVIDGDLSDWKNHNDFFEIHQFISPWGNPNFGNTVFRSFYDQEWFYFCFDIEDKNVVEAPFQKESDVARGDRGEIFITADPDLKEYYCFEISPSAKVLDYIAHYYRKFDYNWNLKGMEIKGVLNKNGYILEGRLPMSFIKSLDKSGSNPLENIKLGIFRAEFNNLNPQDPSVNWISWVKPTTEKPDFHTPSAFKKVKFQSSK